MSMVSGSGSGGDSFPPRYPSNQPLPDRRRPAKNMSRNYYNGGPREGRVNTGGYRSLRGSGDGTNYRNEYEGQQSLSGVDRPSTHHTHRHHSPPGNYQYNQPPHQHQHQPHHRNQPQHQETDGMPYHQGRGGGMSNGSHHHMEHRNGGSYQHQHHLENHAHVPNPANPGHFPPPGASPPQPQPIPGPAMGFVGGFPGTQPMMGTFVLCNIPPGINPASVIASGIQTQVIGYGFLNPTVHLVPSQQVIFQVPPPQHFIHHAQSPFQPLMTSVPPPNHPPSVPEDPTVVFDSAAVLNPDAHAFFPTLSSFSEEVEDMDEGNEKGDSVQAHVTVRPNELVNQKEELVKGGHDSPLRSSAEFKDSGGSGSELGLSSDEPSIPAEQ